MLKTYKNDNFEFIEFNVNLFDIYNCIVNNYLRNKLLNIDSDILVFSNKRQFHIFYEKVKAVLEQLEELGLKFMNSNPTSNGYVKRYLENNTFNSQDMDYILKYTLKKLTRNKRNKSYYDIVILKEYMSKRAMKKLVVKYSLCNKLVSNNLEYLFIYCIYLRSKFFELYN